MKFLKKISSFLHGELGFFLIISVLLLAISITPQIKRQLDTPRDRVFSGLEYYSDDYSIYVSNVFQGQRGNRWTLLDKHTSEPHQGTIIHDEYLLFGKLMHVFGIDAIASYHLFRYAMGFILLMVIYLFLNEIFPNNNDQRPTSNVQRLKRKLSFFLITFSTGFIIINQTPKGIGFDFHLNWLTELDVFYRFVALPHYLIGNIFFLGALINLLRLLKSNSQKVLKIKNLKFKININVIYGALCSLGLALIHPVALVSLMALLGVFLLFINIIKIVSRPIILNSKFLIQILFSKENIYFFILLFTTLPVMLWYKYLMTIPPWNHMAAWEGVTQYFVPLKEFAMAIGPTFYIGIVGIFAMLMKIQNSKFKILNSTLLLLSWPLSFFLLVYFSYPFLGISQVRFMQVFFFIPFAILSAEGIIFIASLVSKTLRIIFSFSLNHLKFLANSSLKNWFIGIFIIFILVNALPNYYYSLEMKYRFFTDFSPLIYPYKDTVKGYYWLRDNTDPESVVLAAFLSNTQIPYFSNNTVYVGHLWATLNRAQKEPLANKFLSNKMEEKEAWDFFRNGRIGYYFHGWQETGYGVDPNRYTFLKPVYNNPMVTIYKANY